MSKQDELPNYGPTDYAKFFGAGALAATLTHGVSSLPSNLPLRASSIEIDT